MPVVDALAERTEEGRVYDRDIDGLVSMNLYPLVSEWSNPVRRNVGLPLYKVPVREDSVAGATPRTETSK